MLVSLALIVAVVLVLQQPASAVVYRWVDDQGVVHFAERVPEGVEATAVSVKPNTVSSVRADPPAAEKVETDPANAEAGQQEEISYAESRRRERAENRRVREEETRINDADCAVMRSQKAQVESGPRVLVRDENGDTRRLLNDERENLLNEANAFLSANCN